MKLKKPRWFLSLSRVGSRMFMYNLRDSENKLCMPLPRTSYYIDSYSGTILWNISHTKWGKQSPLRNSNVFLNKYSIYIDLGHEIRGM